MTPAAAAEDTPTQHAATATVATSTPVNRTAPAREKPSSGLIGILPSSCCKRPETGFEPVSAEMRVPEPIRATIGSSALIPLSQHVAQRTTM